MHKASVQICCTFYTRPFSKPLQESLEIHSKTSALITLKVGLDALAITCSLCPLSHFRVSALVV